MKLTESPKMSALRVTNVASEQGDDIIVRRLMELGFIPGAIIELRHQAPIMNDPIAVLVRGMIVALRRYEAERISVELVS